MAPVRSRRQTKKTIALPPAVIAVLSTAELLENILAYVRLKDLFSWQRVCKNWQTVIKGSKPLKMKMYLLADGALLQPLKSQYPYAHAEPEPEHVLDGCYKLSWRPVVYQDIRHIELKSACVIHVTKSYSRPDDRSKARHENNERKLQERLTSKDNSIAHFSLLRPQRQYDSQVLYVNLMPLSTRIQQNEQAPWRAMFFTQPPITMLEFPEPLRFAAPDDVQPFALRNDAGITFGDVYDHLHSIRAKYDDVWNDWFQKFGPFGQITFAYWSADEAQFLEGINCDGKAGEDGVCGCIRAVMET